MGRFCFALFLLLSAVNADVYLHFPPGSNNRVNENTANRQNANNAFDSQNNNKGGYNVPDGTSAASGTNADLQFFLVSITLNGVYSSSPSRNPVCICKSY
jgi:hypothetical protein